MDQVTPSPSPVAAVPQIVSLISNNWDSIAKPLLALFASIAANPLGAGIGIGVVVLILGLAYWFFKAKIDAWMVERAKDQTEQAKADFIKDQLAQNAENAAKDNAGRDALDNMP